MNITVTCSDKEQKASDKVNRHTNYLYELSCRHLIMQVVSGECGVLAAIKPGKSFVDMSSVEVETAIELYEVCTLTDRF